MSRWINTDPLFVPHAAKAVGIIASPAAVVIAEFDDHNPVAAVLFDGYNGSSVHGHLWIAPDRKAGRKFWWAMFDYCFEQLKVNNVIGTVPATNLAARKLNPRLGFREIAVIPNYYPNNEDMILYRMTPETIPDWRAWAPKEISNGR